MSLDTMPTRALVAQRTNYLNALTGAAHTGTRPDWAEAFARRVLTLEAALVERGIIPTPRPM